MTDFVSKYQDQLTISFGLVFTILNAIFIYFFGITYFAILPFVLLIFFIAISAYDKLFFILTFLTPLSLTLTYFIPQISFNISLFTEPLLLTLLFILFIKFLIYHKINLSIIKHPISIAILFNLVWMLISASTSTMPIVSFKYLLSRLWFVIPMFFFGLTIFKQYKNIKIFLWAYAIGLFIVVIYSTIRLGQTSFLAKNAAHFVVKPFYNDHTAYGAITALITPVFWGLAFKANYNKPYKKIIAFIFAFAFTVGVILSYSRAAWIGLFIAFGVWVAVKLRIKFKYILITTVIIAAFLSAFWFQILDRLEKNRQDSSSNLSEHIMSITNVSTDASNLERLNRWYCAIEMFKEKPLTGWGPGTYQFQYAPFQLERMKTIISTDFGDVGNAHSEYLGPLAEQGVLGMFSVLWLALSIIISGLRIYKQSSDKEVRMLALSITLGFITYFIHGFMNNFLDTDKLAVPFFGFASILVAIDLYHKKKSITQPLA